MGPVRQQQHRLLILAIKCLGAKINIGLNVGSCSKNHKQDGEELPSTALKLGTYVGKFYVTSLQYLNGACALKESWKYRPQF